MATRTQERRLAFLATALPPIVWVVVFFLAPLAIVWAYSFGQNQGLTDVDISGTFDSSKLFDTRRLQVASAGFPKGDLPLHRLSATRKSDVCLEASCGNF